MKDLCNSRRDAGAAKRGGDRSAGVPPAGSRAPRRQLGEVTVRSRGRLPHWEEEGGIYCITFRLADSLPQSVLAKIAWERKDIIRTAQKLGRHLSPEEEAKIRRLSSATIEQYLDRGAGACHLRKPAIAGLVADSLRHFDDQRYHLFAWCLMPNHVHVVGRILPHWTIAAVVHSWKSFSSKQANKILRTSGTFWEREYYDHLVRNESELVRAIAYVEDNPSKAGLVDWPWVWARRRDAGATEGVA
jgi:REP element-mobilizing transposase RayT